MTYPDRLTAFVVDAVEALERTHLPGFRMPGVFGGHEVGPDVSRRTRLVLDDNRLSQRGGNTGAEGAREDIGRAARRVGDDDSYGLGRVRLGDREG